MRKILSLIILIALCYLLVSVTYAKPYTNKDKKEIPIYTEQELKTPISENDYTIRINGEDKGKKIKITKCVVNRGSFISLREFVENIGGTIEWNPAGEDYGYLGKFNIFDTEFKFYGSLESIHDEIIDEEDVFWLDICQSFNGEDVVLPLGTYSPSLFCRFIDNRIYVNTTLFSKSFPRIGYLFGIDETNGLILIDNYDIQREKEYLSKIVPQEYLKNSFYYEEDEFVPRNYPIWDGKLILDKYYEQFMNTQHFQINYRNFIDPTYDFDYSIYNKDEEFYKNLLRSRYYDDFEGEEISVTYSEDLKTYIIANGDVGDFSSTAFDENVKLMIVRAVDGMLLYSTPFS